MKLVITKNLSLSSACSRVAAKTANASSEMRLGSSGPANVG
jgi:hypothetical protein